MLHKKTLISLIVIVVLSVGYYLYSTHATWRIEDRSIKVFMVHSYYSQYPSVVESDLGFQDYLESKDVDIEVRQYYLGEDRDYSDEKLQLEAKQAMQEIDTWQPDVLYLTDDYASQYVGVRYVDSDMLIVVSGVNEEIEDYDFDTAKNVVGVLDRERLEFIIKELKSLVPEVESVAVISDTLNVWSTSMQRLKASQSDADVDVLGWHTVKTFAEYQSLVHRYQDQVDALVILGVNILKDEAGQSVSKGTAMEWDFFNSRLPSVGMATNYARWGGLLELSADNYQHGRSAAELCYKVVVQGYTPEEVGFLELERNKRIINLARAENLGIDKNDISSVVLINSEIVTSLPWEEENTE